MRQTTRKKYYGRSTVIPDLRGALNDLNAAMELAEKSNPLATALQKVIASLKHARESCEIYHFGGKRTLSKLSRISADLAQLINEFQAIPVFPEEKIKAQHERLKVKAEKKVIEKKVTHGRNDKRNALPDTGSRAKGRKAGTGRASR